MAEAIDVSEIESQLLGSMNEGGGAAAAEPDGDQAILDQIVAAEQAAAEPAPAEPPGTPAEPAPAGPPPVALSEGEPAATPFLGQDPPVATPELGSPPGPAPSGPPPVTAILEHMQSQYGKDYRQKYASDDQFLQSYVALDQQIGRRNEEADRYRQIMQDPEAFSRHYLSQLPVEQQPGYRAPEQQVAPLENVQQPTLPPLPGSGPAQPPATPAGFNTAWIPHLRFPEGTPQGVIDEFTQFARNEPIRQQMEPLQRRYDEQAAQIQALQQQVKANSQPQGPTQQEVAQQTYDQRRAAEDDQEFSRNYVADNRHQLFINGDLGGPNRLGQMTPVGMAFQKYLNIAETPREQGGLGLVGSRHQVQWAEAMTNNEIGRQMAPPPPPPNGNLANRVPGLTAAPQQTEELSAIGEHETPDNYALRMMRAAGISV